MTRPSIYLTNMTVPSHGTIYSSKFSNTYEPQGWGNSTIKEICDKRIFSGLPILL